MNSTPDTPAALSSAPPCVVADDRDRWFREEVQPHDWQLKAWLTQQFPSIRHEVEDVAQESYLRLWRRQAEKPIAQVKAFLFRAARNAAIDLLRRNKRSPFDPIGDLAASRVIEESPDAAQVLTAKEVFELLTDAVASLPPRRYEVIVLHKFRGLSQREVGMKLGIAERTVEEHVRAAVKQCEDYLRSKGVVTSRGGKR